MAVEFFPFHVGLIVFKGIVRALHVIFASRFDNPPLHMK